MRGKRDSQCSWDATATGLFRRLSVSPASERERTKGVCKAICNGNFENRKAAKVDLEAPGGHSI